MLLGFLLHFFHITNHVIHRQNIGAYLLLLSKSYTVWGTFTNVSVRNVLYKAPKRSTFLAHCGTNLFIMWIRYFFCDRYKRRHGLVGKALLERVSVFGCGHTQCGSSVTLLHSQSRGTEVCFCLQMEINGTH